MQSKSFRTDFKEKKRLSMTMDLQHELKLDCVEEPGAFLQEVSDIHS